MIKLNVEKETMFQWLFEEIKDERLELVNLIEKANEANMTVQDYLIKNNSNIKENIDGTYSYFADIENTMTLEEIKKVNVLFEYDFYEDDANELTRVLDLMELDYEDEIPMSAEGGTTKVKVRWVCSINEYKILIHELMGNVENELLALELAGILSFKFDKK